MGQLTLIFRRRFYQLIVFINLLPLTMSAYVFVKMLDHSVRKYKLIFHVNIFLRFIFMNVLYVFVISHINHHALLIKVIMCSARGRNS